MTEPKSINQEILINTDETIMVKTNRFGIIEYVNMEYATISEYDIDELIGQDVSILKHPDVPSTVFDHIWEKLFKKQRTFAILKNLSKTGKYFWLQVNFDFKVNEKTRDIQSIYAYYSKASTKAKKELDILYKKIEEIENHSGIEVAENYIEGYLDEKSIDYNTLIESYLQ